MSNHHKPVTNFPVNQGMLLIISEHFPNVQDHNLFRIFEIMSHNFNLSTLGFMGIVSMLSRSLRGSRDDASFGLGAGLRFSAVAKNKRGLVQTSDMTLLHGAMIDLPMAGHNWRRLNSFLNETFKKTLVPYYGSGMAMIQTSDLLEFERKSGPEQKLRSRLEWNGENQVNCSLAYMTSHCDYSEHEAEFLDFCIQTARHAVNLSNKADFVKS